MTADDEPISERLAQVRADRRHLNRVRVAERRDVAHEDDARSEAERKAQREPADARWSESALAEDGRTVLLAEESALTLERSSLVADRDIGGDIA